MKRTVTTPALLALLALSCFSFPSLADPLHKIGKEGAWVHVDSGWVFPKAVGDFARVAQPYSIDGNNDAGVEYRQDSGPLQAEVEIYAADSGAVSATLDGAKGHAARKAGEAARVQSEKAFEIDAMKDVKGVKVTYAAQGKSEGTQINLYYFTTDRWRVKVLASTQDRGGDRALDAFVQGLPWKTLGTDPGIH
jgi:hypothetical protein